jgi:AmiR/NasT family two-component response regulator
VDLWVRKLIEQAQGIIMNRFGLDAVRALEVVRKMSQNTRTRMCVVLLVSRHFMLLESAITQE